MAAAFALPNKQGLFSCRLPLPRGFVGSPPGQIAPSWRAGSAGAAK